MDRRAFLTTVGCGWALDVVLPGPLPITGRIVGASHAAGHLLRDGHAVPRGAARTERADVAIVGSGVAGLSAAWRLRDAGLDVLVLELEPFVGGTSTWGDDGASPHPWGAHYLAAPNPEARAALRLLREIGAVTGFDAAGRPELDPRRLCHAPQERLFYEGAWHPGLVPTDALGPDERAEMARFAEIEQRLTDAVGRDGRPLFQIPIELSSRDPEALALDAMTMDDWLRREGFRTPFVRWYVRYAMLDDFGGAPDDVSAWAGLHYFAARKLRTPELEGSRYLVWPEGNGRLVRALLEGSRARVRRGALATAIETAQRGVTVRGIDVATREALEIACRAVVIATPAFVARRIAAPLAAAVTPRAASPWLVANLHVEQPIDPDRPWDSVVYDAEGLGYVDARHQLTEPSERTVLTYYRAYGERDVAASRAALLGLSWVELAEAVLRDLAGPHPDLRERLERIDVMVWGHGMPRPRPGFLGSRPFEAPVLLADRVAWAHVDQSGIALFEEAQARGVRAAEALAAAIGVDLGESWL